MAGVTPDGKNPVPDDRGQLILVFALGIAVLLVVLALLLNGVVYAESVPKRSVDGDAGGSAAEFRAAAGDAGGRLVAAANAESDSSYTSLRTALRSGIDRWSNLSGRPAPPTGVRRPPRSRRRPTGPESSRPTGRDP